MAGADASPESRRSCRRCNRIQKRDRGRLPIPRSDRRCARSCVVRNVLPTVAAITDISQSARDGSSVGTHMTACGERRPRAAADPCSRFGIMGLSEKSRRMEIAPHRLIRSAGRSNLRHIHTILHSAGARSEAARPRQDNVPRRLSAAF